jgi:hypothetical protein
MFIAPGLFRYYRVPLAFEQFVAVNRRFHLHPLLPLLQSNGRFYLLAISQNQVRFFEGTQEGLHELHPESLPESLQDALNIDERVGALQFHSDVGHAASRPSVGRGGGSVTPKQAVFHGQGSAADAELRKRDEILQYFYRVNDGLRNFFGEERVPLVFAGVEYLFPLFRQAVKYRHLLDEPITGNPDKLSAGELHAKAWSVVQPHFEEAQKQALVKYSEQAHSDWTSHDADEIIAATRRGRVDTLLVAAGHHVWGTVDEETGDVERCDRDLPQAEDLVDYATVHTLRNGGQAFVLPPERLPAGNQMIALFRYPIRETSEAASG